MWQPRATDWAWPRRSNIYSLLYTGRGCKETELHEPCDVRRCAPSARNQAARGMEKMKVGMSKTVGFCADLRRCNLARWRLHRQSALAHPKRKNDCLNVLQEMLGGCGSAAASNAGTKGSLYDTLRIKRRSSTSDITLHRKPYQEALPLSRHRL